MTKSNQRELFLKYLAKIYLYNPDLPITEDTIYDELTAFNIENEKIRGIIPKSLVGIQVKLNNSFPKNSFTNEYYWALENRNELKDKEFYETIQRGIELHVAVNPEDLYQISEKIFKYMFEENITMQCRISKVMRNDALVLKVATTKEAQKIISFIKKLNYSTQINPNPFLLTTSDSRVAIAKDGSLSYNRVLSKLIKAYFTVSQNTKGLANVTAKGFKNFCQAELSLLRDDKDSHHLRTYDIKNPQEYNDFLIVTEQIIKNIDNELTEEELFQYDTGLSSSRDVPTKTFYTKEEEQKILYILDRLSNYYGIEDAHRIIIKYIDTGNISYFTRRDSIRRIVLENFSPQRLKEILTIMGYNALVSASDITLQKYNYEQLNYAINNMFTEGKIDGFTNRDNARSYLGMVGIPKLLSEALAERAGSKGVELTPETISNIIIDEINEGINKKSR